MTAAAEIRRKATLVADYLARQLPRRPAAAGGVGARPPLMVSMQGPQGCGKSSVAAALVAVLSDRGVRAAVASLDDFYLPHAGLRALAAAQPSNALLAGRGPPGTHDVELLARVLADLRRGDAAALPVFDKSLHGGAGDRAGEVHVPAGLDVFALEGWSLGFAPIADTDVGARAAAGRTARTHPVESLLQLNRGLAEMQAATASMFDAHVGIRPPGGDYGIVYAWRLEQEHKMKERNGGRGMSDDEVRRFVDRYMPVYEVWGESTGMDRPSLWMTFGPEREVLGVEEREAGV